VTGAPSVSSAEAARRLGVSRASVHRLVESGRLRGETRGNRLWVEEHSIAALLRMRTVDNPNAFAALDRLHRKDKP
jgi:excisionase family DNA binding protein